MARSATETTLAELPHLHRSAVRIGAASAWFVAALYLVAAAITGDSRLNFEALAPALAAAFMTTQVALGREDASLALFGSGSVVVVWYTVLGDESTIVPAAVALVLIAALGMLFVPIHRLLVSVVLGLGLFAIPWLWDQPPGEGMVLGGVMAISFLVTHAILGSIQRALASVSARYRMLFEESPTAALEEDWSEAIAYVRSEYTGKPQRLRQFLLAYPAVVEKAVTRARIVRANDAALELLEISDRERLLGYRRPSAVTSENLEGWVGALVALYAGARNWEAELAVRSRSGELRCIQARGVDSSTDDSATSIVVALADITHMKARSEAMEQLVKAKDEFIATISHELRTPLTAVLGLTTELVSGEELASDERSELLELVASQAADMADIVEDLLVAARAEMGTVTLVHQEVDLLEEARATVDAAGIAVEFPDEDLPDVIADAQRVRQILRNLLTNVKRYGGPRCRIAAGSGGGSAWIEVCDDGRGVPEEDAERIFHPYVTGMSRAAGSVGLGLAVSRQLAELMGGSLRYERRGAETVFRLELPLATRPAGALASHTGHR